MEIKSLCWIESRWHQVNVEVLLVPGLPQIQYLGLADRSIKEGALRVKTALRCCGFTFPSAQQVVVNISPSSIQKSSTGVDLAVALGILGETGQLGDLKLEDAIAFGELGLDGKISVPADFSESDALRNKNFLGNGEGLSFNGNHMQIESLSDLREALKWKQKKKTLPEAELKHDHLSFTEKQAEWLMLQNLGEFHTLLAGPQGAGKSTIVNALPTFLERTFKGEMFERNLFAPHHSITTQALIGGGAIPQPGEISRAHGGVLFLDEFLEFEAPLLESLRRPFEEGKIEIHRVGSHCLFPCEALIIAATNLCPCGRWVPETQRQCSYSRPRCLKPLHRLSGPLLDRFQILFLLPRRKVPRVVSALDIRAQISEVRSWMKSEGVNVDLPLRNWKKEHFLAEEWAIGEEYFGTKHSSERRQLATLRVAKAFQWMERGNCLRYQHLQRALEWTLIPFDQLESAIY